VAHGFFDAMAGTITNITAQKRGRRVNIYLDGEYAFSLDRLTAAWLKRGSVLSDAEISQLRSRDQNETAYAKTLHFLSFRVRSIKEVQGYLNRSGLSAEESAVILNRLQDEGFLDDSRFSRDWIENRVTFRPRSSRQLRLELLQKGVTAEQADEALEVANLDEASLAKAAAGRMARRWAELNQQEFLSKTSDFLLRRGFTRALARETARELWAEHAKSQHVSENNENME